MRFSHAHCPDGPCSTLLSHGCILEAALAMGMVAAGRGGEGVQSIHPKDRGAGRGLQLPGATSRVSQQSHRLPDLLQHHRTLHLPVTVMSAKNKINL